MKKKLKLITSSSGITSTKGEMVLKNISLDSHVEKEREKNKVCDFIPEFSPLKINHESNEEEQQIISES